MLMILEAYRQISFFPSLFQFYRNVKGYNKKLHDDMYAYFLYSFCHMLLFGPIAVSNFF